MPTSTSFLALANQRITDLVRREALESSRVQATNPRLSQTLVNTRAQLAALRWTIMVDRASLAARLAELPKLIAQAEQLRDLLQARKHLANEPAQDAAHDLVSCLHGEEFALKYMDAQEITDPSVPETV